MGILQWKERNAAVTALEAVLQGAGGRIQPNVGDLLPALKVRIAPRCVKLLESQMRYCNVLSSANAAAALEGKGRGMSLFCGAQLNLLCWR